MRRVMGGKWYGLFDSFGGAKKHGLLDNVPTNKILEWEADFLAHLRSNESDMLAQIDREGALSKELEAKLKEVATTFTKSFVA